MARGAATSRRNCFTTAFSGSPNGFSFYTLPLTSKLVHTSGVIDTTARRDTCFSRTTEEFSKEPVRDARRVSNAETRGKTVVLSGRESTGNPGIARKHEAGGRVGIDPRLYAGHKGLDSVLRIIEWLADFPTQPIVERQV